MSRNMKASLVCNALNMALVNRGYSEGVLFHSDRGSQYCSYAFRDILDEYQFVQSMSRKGNYWDNAEAESFFKSLKIEATDDVEFNTIEEAKRVGLITSKFIIIDRECIRVFSIKFLLNMRHSGI